MTEAQSLDERLQTLKQAIEDLRCELHELILKEGSVCGSERAYSVSHQLDKVIVQFLRICEKLERE
ncbi:MAG: aspartyl-phosphate phosphatase Spo0E family protein [Firmicutes bacterium]|jgi:hypothetical protein|nr:aspartyl-phosphate phosphatase Spo0E family protein [Bacillota bacterium]